MIESYDPLVVGRRVRELRTAAGLTLSDLAGRLGRAPSHLSMVENGKRELRLGELHAMAGALGVDVGDLLSQAPRSRRAQLEIALERAQRSPLFTSLGLAPLAVRKTLPDQAIETVLALLGELEKVHEQRAATPEQARRANTALRAEMRRRGNHLAELEATAATLLAAVGHTSGPLSQRVAADLAAHLGFTIHHVRDLPASTRSLTDLEGRRIYLPQQSEAGRDPRSTLLQALAGAVLGHEPPEDYESFLRQRVESNYLAGALLVPQATAVPLLKAAKERRELSVEDLRDAYAVTYETAAHRFTNLATEHLGIPVHFLKAHESGAIAKAYENDDVQFPSDALGTVEGQLVCRNWAARRVFDVEDRFTPYHQLTDKPGGTYWCTSSIQPTGRGAFSLSVGTAYAHAKWFRGMPANRRFTSTCPDESCCRTPPPALARRWHGRALPTPRLNASLFATLPTVPGPPAAGASSSPSVDITEAYRFLDRHAGAEPDVRTGVPPT
jgi:predicted transcriptional regulator/DNA-binding Xre family transcriptional regulator